MTKYEFYKIKKKGVNYFWVGLLVVIIGAIVVLLFYKLYSGSLEGTIGSADCKTALALIAGAEKIRITNFVDLSSLLKKACKPVRIVIDKEDFNEANKKIADAMLDCALLGETYFRPALPGGVWNTIKGLVGGDWWLVNFKCADIVFTERGAKNYREGACVFHELKKDCKFPDNAETFRDWIESYNVKRNMNLRYFFEKELKFVNVFWFFNPNDVLSENVYTIYLSTFVISEAEFNNLAKGVSWWDVVLLPISPYKLIRDWVADSGFENAYKNFYGGILKKEKLETLNDALQIYCILESRWSYNKKIKEVDVQKLNF